MAQANGNLSDTSQLSALGRALVELRHEIFRRWERDVREVIPEAQKVRHPVLIDTLPAFITNLAEAVTEGHPRHAATERSMVAQEHGSERARLTTFGVENIVREYKIFRSTILNILSEKGIPPTHHDIIRINDFIDEAIQDAIVGFAIVHSDLREKFVAALTHDLKNSLSASQVAVQMILRNPTHENVPILAARIADANKRMDRMIGDLLDVSMVRSGGRLKLNPVECDMLALVNECVAESMLINGTRFSVQGVPCKGFWDPSALKRAIDNLLGNAVKYGDPQRFIAAKVHSEHGRAFVSIHNDGPPIALEDQEALFQVYRRSSAAKRSDKKGWGLGLAIVRAVAESHGGSVVLDSMLDRGTTFTIDVPSDSRPFQDAPCS